MNVLALAVLAQVSAPVAAPQTTLSELVSAVRAADYRGAREDLKRLAVVLERPGDPGLEAYRHYWRGFAWWRRALNGFNETPRPEDLEHDLREGVASFRAALAQRPEWVEPRIGLVGCWSALLYVPSTDGPRREALLKEALPVVRDVEEHGSSNPRALWLNGGAQVGAAPPRGGDLQKAAATFRRGVASALDEQRSIAADEPVWIPRWGGAENLMSLAYLYTHTAVANRPLALAYAEGALLAAPDWHYVRDVLWPQIMALPDPPSSSRP
jgi:hypothetical protein